MNSQDIRKLLADAEANRPYCAFHDDEGIDVCSCKPSQEMVDALPALAQAALDAIEKLDTVKTALLCEPTCCGSKDCHTHEQRMRFLKLLD